MNALGIGLTLGDETVCSCGRPAQVGRIRILGSDGGWVLGTTCGGAHIEGLVIVAGERSHGSEN